MQAPGILAGPVLDLKVSWQTSY